MLTFNSCISRPDVCQCLVLQHPWKICQRNMPCTSMINAAGQPKLHLGVRIGTCGPIHAQDGWRSGVRSCIMPGLPTHIVHELNAGTVRLSWTGLWYSDKGSALSGKPNASEEAVLLLQAPCMDFGPLLRYFGIGVIFTKYLREKCW